VITLQRRQSGTTLFVTLIMLVILTLMVVGSINLNNNSLKVVGNMQTQKSADGAAQVAIESLISTYAYFAAPAVATLTVDGYSVNVASPVCKRATLAAGYQYDDPMAPEDTHWEVQASATDSSSGAGAVMHQGIKMRLPAGNCP
jgi:Tfp pilus assembly protein PilX